MEICSYLLLFLLVFGMSATVNLESLQKQIRNKEALLTGILLQFGVLPFLGFAVVKALDLSSPMGITLLVLTSSPGGSYSNWWCSMFNADLALSVTMTAISTILSVAMLPLNLFVYSTFTYSGDVVRSLDWISLFTSLFVVIGAIFSGLICSTKIHNKKFNLMANKLGNVAGLGVLLFSIFVSTTGDTDTNSTLWVQPWEFYFGVALPCVVGLCIANFLTSFFKLEKPERVTVSVECCYQNVGIAASVALTMFEGDDLNQAIGVPLYYGGIEGLVLGLYCVVAWKLGWTKAPKDESICIVVGKSYEIIEVDDDVDMNDVENNEGENRVPVGTKKNHDRNGQEDEDTFAATESIGATASLEVITSVRNDKNLDGSDDDGISVGTSKRSLWWQHGALSFLSFGTAPNTTGSTHSIQIEPTNMSKDGKLEITLTRNEENLDDNADDGFSVESSESSSRESSSRSGWGLLGECSFDSCKTQNIKAGPVNMTKDGLYDLNTPYSNTQTEPDNMTKDGLYDLNKPYSNTQTDPTNVTKDGLYDLELPNTNAQNIEIEPIDLTKDGAHDLKG